MKIKKSLGESLVEEGIITKEQLEQAKAEERKTGNRLRKVLVKMGLISEDDLVTFLAEKLGIVRIELSNYLIHPEIMESIPEELARKYEIMPVLKIGNRLTCAMTDPWNVFALDEIRLKTNLIIEPAAATEAEIKKPSMNIMAPEVQWKIWLNPSVKKKRTYCRGRDTRYRFKKDRGRTGSHEISKCNSHKCYPRRRKRHTHRTGSGYSPFEISHRWDAS